MALLDYIGHLSRQETEDLPQLLADFRDELFESTWIPDILGFNDMRDPEQLQQLLEYDEQRAAEYTDGPFTNRQIVLALSQIPGERCAQLLHSLFPNATSARKLDIVRGLVSNGGPAALDALRHLEEEVKSQTLKRVQILPGALPS